MAPAYPQPNPAYSAVLQDVKTRKWLGFSDPLEILEARGSDQVMPVLRQAEEAAWQQGLWAVGFVCYESASAFDPALVTHPRVNDLPLVWFGLYPKPEELCGMPSSLAADILAGSAVAGTVEDDPARINWQPSIAHHDYSVAIRRIKDEIARGATYQVNYTYRLHASVSLDPWLMFQHLAAAQQAEYAAYLDTGPAVICSSSPELFFRLDGHRIESRPMKGTAARGRFLAEDRDVARWLRNSVKNRAENIMIVDMVRNDLGRVAKTGSVKVERLFEVERYPTVWQMTSTVTALTNAGLPEIFGALFPCASITGAPKPSTMRIIRELEAGPRGIYTGALGFVAPGRKAQFNVAIRTVVFDRQKSRAGYGVGGGILWDSDIEAEYEECRDKARVLTRRRADFALLESLLWEPENGYFLLQEHVSRLAASADYFGFVAEHENIMDALQQAVGDLPAIKHKVRLLVWPRGRVVVEAKPLAKAGEPAGPVRLALATEPVDSSDVFLFHKTTRRLVYTRAMAGRGDCDDVILFNEKGEITETTIANLVVELGGKRLTPPVTCGLLGGTMRARLLRQGEIQEAVIARAELLDASRIWVINSVHAQREAVLGGYARILGIR